MPSSLIIVALVIAWLVVLVPMAARKRQGVAENAASADHLARGTRSSMEEEYAMPDAEELELAELEAEFDDDYLEEDDYLHYERQFRPGRGGYDPETAAIVAQARYAFRRRVVAFMLFAALVTGLIAGILYPIVWWGHAGVDVVLFGYLVYLRRQVRMEEDIRARRQARLAQARRRPLAPRSQVEHERVHAEREERREEEPRLAPQPRFQHQTRPGTVVVDADDEDPMFVELDGPHRMPYRRAVGE